MAAAKLLNSDKDDSDQLHSLTQFGVILSALIHGKWGRKCMESTL